MSWMCLKENGFEYVGFGLLLIGGNVLDMTSKGDKGESTGCIWMHRINQFGPILRYKERDNVK